MNRTITWLHLSDLHARLSNEWDADRITSKLVDNLREAQLRDSLYPDFIFFTGDAAYGIARGESMTDQYERVRLFLDRVLSAFHPPLPKRRLYIVPGNHDVDRTRMGRPDQEWLRASGRTLDDILMEMRDDTLGWRNWMLHLSAYREFLNRYDLGHLKPDDPYLVWGDAQEIAGIRLGIAGFNSSWSCMGNDDKGKLWWGGEFQLAKIREQMGPVTFAFALVHHPSNWLTSYEDPRVMRYIRNEFPLVLHGHEHLDWPEGSQRGHFLLSAGACYQGSHMPNAYSFGQLDLNTRTGRLFLRKWDAMGGGWVKSNVFEHAPEGIWSLGEMPWLPDPKVVRHPVQDDSESGNDSEKNSNPSIADARGTVESTASTGDNLSLPTDIVTKVASVDSASNASATGHSPTDIYGRPVTSSALTSDDIVRHYTQEYCRYVVGKNSYLELFGCDIPHDARTQQLSVAYVPLNLSTESVEELLPVVPQPVENAGSTNPKMESNTGDRLSTQIKTTNDDRRKTAFLGNTSIDRALDQIASGSNRLIIRGPAGAGKTTLLRWCAVHASQNVLSLLAADENGGTINKAANRDVHSFELSRIPQSGKTWSTKIPVLIRLRDCPKGKLPAAAQIPRFIAKHLPSPPLNWMTNLLAAGNALVLFDGVDEIHNDKRDILCTEIAELIRMFPHCTYVVTTRPGAVTRGWLDQLNFDEARVEPLERVDREKLISCWYDAAALEIVRPRLGEDFKEQAAKLKDEVNDQPELALLASNPLLCAMICALYRERSERLPDTPADLCEALTRMLVDRRERESGLEGTHVSDNWLALNYEQKKGILCEIASEMLSRGVSSIKTTRAERILAALLVKTSSQQSETASTTLRAFLERSGVLRLANNDQEIEFVHNTIKEYLAAERYVEHNDFKSLVFRTQDPAWQPVILFALARASEEFSKGLMESLALEPQEFRRYSIGSKAAREERGELTPTYAYTFFLARCRASARWIEPKYAKVIDQLTSSLFPPKTLEDADILSQIGPRMLAYAAKWFGDIHWLEVQTSVVGAACLRMLRKIGGARAKRILETCRYFTGLSPSLVGEWMLASSELCDATMSWPFDEVQSISLVGQPVTDLRPLVQVTSWEDIDLSNSQISDLYLLGTQSQLRSLNINGSAVRNLVDCSELTTLQTLSFQHCQINDLTPLARLSQLRVVDLSNNHVDDLAPLSVLQQLEVMDASSNRVSDLTPLARLDRLTRVSIEKTQVSDLSPLAGMRGLRQLTFSYAPIHELSPIAQLNKIQKLSMAHTPVNNLKPLSGLRDLQDLDLSGSAVEDISPLVDMKKLQRLDISNTNITDLILLQQLPFLSSLSINNINIDNLNPIASLKGLQELFCNGVNLSSLYPLYELPLLRLIATSHANPAAVESFKRRRSDVQVF